MITQHYIELNEDVLDYALGFVSDKTLAIYPTELNVNLSENKFRSYWRFENTGFCSIDSLKLMLLNIDRPLLQEDKRLLCLYQSLTETEREFFHINSYDDIIEWGQNYLNFMEELHDECLSIDDISKLNDTPNRYLQEWQNEYLKHLQDVTLAYRQLSQEKGFQDIIFTQIDDYCLDLPYDRYIFVNQFYYTKLEKALLQNLDTLGKEVIVIYQGKQSWFDGKQDNEIDLNELWASGKNNLRSIKICQTQTEEQQIMCFLNEFCHEYQSLGKSPLPHDVTDVKSRAIVDRNFFNKSYQRFFNPELFKYNRSLPMTDTVLYRLLSLFYTGLGQLVIESPQSYLLSTKWVLSFIVDEQCVRYIVPEFTDHEINRLTDEIVCLIEKDFLYIDSSLEIFSDTGSHAECTLLKTFLRELLKIIDVLLKINSIRDFVQIIDTSQGLQVQRMVTSEEQEFTDILHVFYERLANVYSIEELGIVNAWTDVYNQSPTAVPAGILGLFLRSLASKRLQVKHIETSKAVYFVTHLLDTRNIRYDKTVVFNAVENEYPSAPASVWMLNEAQREALGLKTWKSIRVWERYYFFRLLFSAKYVEIYTYHNPEQDIEISSFVEELSLSDFKNITEVVHIEPLMKDFYRIVLPSVASQDTKDLRLASKKNIIGLPDEHEKFFTIPAELEADFPQQKKIVFSFYALQEFLDNPFMWYLRQHCKIDKKDLSIEATIGRKMFGILFHEFMKALFGNIASGNTDNASIRMNSFSSDQIGIFINDLISKIPLKLKIPRNYNALFLEQIIVPYLAEIAEWVISKLQAKIDFSSPDVHLYTEQYANTEHISKPLLNGNNNSPLDIYLKGMADLRIDIADSKAFIYDFKTGKKDADFRQLVFYEYLYYLLPDIGIYDIEASFCSIFEKKIINLPQEKQDKLLRLLRENLLKRLQDCFNGEGYRQSSSQVKRKNYTELTRADLFVHESELYLNDNDLDSELIADLEEGEDE